MVWFGIFGAIRFLDRAWTLPTHGITVIHSIDDKNHTQHRAAIVVYKNHLFYNYSLNTSKALQGFPVLMFRTPL
jgi:hypothetical protein